MSAEFYRDLFGFRETFRIPKKGTPVKVELQLGSLTLGVGTSDSVLKFHGFSTGGGPPRAEVVLWTDDVDKAFSSLIERGVKPLSAPHDFAGIVRVAWVTDPDGNPVQIVSKAKAR